MSEQSRIFHQSLGVDATNSRHTWSDCTWREITEEMSKESDCGKIGALANELIDAIGREFYCRHFAGSAE